MLLTRNCFRALQPKVAHFRMASSTSKLIFAPGSDSNSKQAAQFTKASLSESDLDSNPIHQFDQWFKAAQEAKIRQVEACTLATAQLPSGRVSARVVYLKELCADGESTGDARGGFVVYSNWGTSQKQRDFKTNRCAALTFWWKEAERQVRVEGHMLRIEQKEAQVYFDTRGRGSRIGAWASQQSKVLRDRDELEKQVEEQEKRWEGKDEIQVPEFWGGMKIVPESIEFWQGRDSRLHDRFKYTREGGGNKWKIERLSP